MAVAFRAAGHLPRLRRRLVLAAVGSAALALAAICLAINVLNYALTCQRADGMAEVIHDNGGIPLHPSNRSPSLPAGMGSLAEMPYRTRYFTVTLDDEGGTVSLDTSHVAAVDATEALDMAREILAGGRLTGFRGSYRFSVFDDGGGERTVVVLDCSTALDALQAFQGASAAVWAVCILITLALVIPLSARAIRPFEENATRQRRFVADASHEIKTPIAIISANNDLIERLDGPNRWTESTRTQVERIDGLVRGLMDLARAEEPPDRSSIGPVDLSRVADDACGEFQPLSDARGEALVRKLEEGVTVTGSTDDMERLVGILLDNAIKYCEGAGPVVLELASARRRGRRVAVLTVSNPCSALSEGDADLIFDRFYRADPSRSRDTGSYGIGLALARAIVGNHGGSISAEVARGSVSLVVTLPLRRD